MPEGLWMQSGLTKRRKIYFVAQFSLEQKRIISFNIVSKKPHKKTQLKKKPHPQKQNQEKTGRKMRDMSYGLKTSMLCLTFTWCFLLLGINS